MSEHDYFSPTAEGLTVGVVGAGVMGRGIAQLFAEAGVTVLLADASADAVSAARDFCAGMIERKVAKGKLDAAAAEAAAGRIRTTDAGPEHGYAAFADCDLVIEAVVERMDIKHAVLAGVEQAVSAQCIIASNTSSLSVTGFAAAAERPGRIAGLHFFNPVPLMRLVEVIGGERTDAAALDALAGLVERTGHHPVRAADTPGFLVNHAGRGYTTEALRIVSEGICAPADIDRVMTDAAGFRMGPFTLLDLTGLDVSHKVMESIYTQYYNEPRHRPVPLVGRRVTAGLLGRKTGEGFYRYVDGKQQWPDEVPAPSLPAKLPPVWISAEVPEWRVRLAAIFSAAGANVESAARPSRDALIVVTPLGADATTAALGANLDAHRTVAVDCLLGLDARRTLMATPVTGSDRLAAAHALLGADGTPVTAIEDSPGFIAQRIIAAIVNVGADIAQQRIAAPADIDQGVRLGLGYPRGSLEFGDSLGPWRVLAILDAMHAFYGDPRYRASPWLRRRALLGAALSDTRGSGAA